MKLDYFDLLSPEPIYVYKIGSIVSPKLRDISKNGGIKTYYNYLSTLFMEPKTYFSLMNKEQEFESLSDKEKEQLNIFDLLVSENESIKYLEKILNFFIHETVTYSHEYNAFLVYNNENNLVGIISNENYYEVCNLIFQRNNIKKETTEDLSKIKSKKALEIMKKLQKGREKKAKTTKADEKMEIGNIVSAVANKSHSLNILNVWDLTVYQIWDAFSRLVNNNIYDIQSMGVAAWGNKDNHFDSTAWFKRIDNEN